VPDPPAPRAGKKRLPLSRGGERLYAELAALRDEPARRRFFARHRKLVRPETVARLAETVSRHVRVDVHEALALAEAAEHIARKLKGAEPLAQALRAKGNALHFLNEHKAALRHHEEAARLFGEAGRPTEVGRTLSTSIQPLILLGEYQRAEEAAARAREIFAREGDDLRLARLELNVGNIYHRQDRFAEALTAYERAYERLLPHKDVEGIGVALHNMAMDLISLNDFPRALETHRRARAFCAEHGMPRLVALADYNIAYLFYFRGQYGQAIEALKTTQVECRRVGDDYLGSLCMLDLAEIYLELNLSEEAADMASEALAGFRHLRAGYEAAKSLGYMAIAFGQQGKVLRALELCNEARALFVQERNTVWSALMDLYQALILFGAGRLFESRRHCNAALRSFKDSALASKAILCRLLLARLALRMGDLEGAQRECDVAAESLAGLDLPALGFQLHYVKGQIQQAAGRPREAFESYRSAQGFLETLRSSLRGEELKIAFMKNKLEVYEGLVELSLAGGSNGSGAAEAFAYVEQAKSRSLQELLLRAATPLAPTSSGKSELVRRVSDLREELNWYYHRIEAEQMAPEERTVVRLEKLHGQVEARESELLRVLRELPAEGSEPLELLAPVRLPLEAIRAALPADAMIVEYFRLGQRLVAFLVTRERLDVVPVSLVPRVQHLLRLLQFQLSWARPQAGEVSLASRAVSLSATQTHLEELYQELLAPLRPRLDKAHLIFVPHDLLHYVPFHALHDGERHLIDSFSVSYAPSATIYALCHGRTTNAAECSLVLGVPEPHTPFIADEVRSVAARLPGAELYVGPEASESVLREKGEHCRFVHIAAHGFFRPDNPMFSGIRLGSSYLTLYDLYSLKLPAELVSLSACVTGLNVIGAGDELLGLTRGLFRAGAASLLVTLWEVPDQSTAEFMKAFYERLLGQPNRAAALREAILEIRQRYPHPVHWAPFLLSGKVLAG
jgi:CHAT domain-containing protein/predicted negative regulator of RcsB-dependent stress response